MTQQSTAVGVTSALPQAWTPYLAFAHERSLKERDSFGAMKADGFCCDIHTTIYFFSDYLVARSTSATAVAASSDSIPSSEVEEIRLRIMQRLFWGGSRDG